MSRNSCILLVLLGLGGAGRAQLPIEWVPIGESLPELAWPMTVHGDTVFVVRRDGGVIYTSTDRGASWEERSTSGLAYLDFLWLTTSDGIHFIPTYTPGEPFTISRSTDSGRNWEPTKIIGADPRTPYLIDLFETQIGTLLAGTFYDDGLFQHGEVLRSVDGGQTWVLAPYVDSVGPTQSIAQAQDGALYSAHSPQHQETRGPVLRSVDDGQTWEKVFDSSDFGYASMFGTVGTPGGGVLALGICCNTSYIFHSPSGDEWNLVSTIPNYVNRFLRVGEHIIAFGWFYTQGPPYLSQDGGLTWESVGEGLPSSATDMKHDADGYLYAISNRQVFRTAVPLPVATEPVSAVPEAVHLSVPEPNPTRASTRLSFALQWPTEVDLTIFDLLGRRIASVAKGMYGAGTHTLSWSTASLPIGTYVVLLHANGQRLSQRLVVVR